MKLLEPKWIKEDHVKRYAQLLMGLESSYKEDKVYIDYSAAKSCLYFNLLGFKTAFHCSGVSREHKKVNSKYIQNYTRNLAESSNISLEEASEFVESATCATSRNAYISFKGVYPEIEKFLPPEMDYDESQNLYGPSSCIRINKEIADDETVQIWRELETKLEKVLTLAAK